MSTPTDDGWIKLSERLPDKFPCEVYSEKTLWQGIAHLGYGKAQANVVPKEGWPCGTDCNHDHVLTHWKPLKLSDPPKPEVSEEEIAFDNWRLKRWEIEAMNSAELRVARTAWLAALEFARKEKL